MRQMDNFKRLALTILALVLCMFSVWGTLSRAGAETMWVNTERDKLTGRSKPKLGALAVCWFSNGEEVTVLDMSNGWAKLDYGGEADYSYVSWDFLTDDDDLQYIVVAPGGLNVRNNPDGKKVVSKLKDGAIVDVAFTFDGWAKVEKGWIKTWYLEPAEIDLSVEED